FRLADATSWNGRALETQERPERQRGCRRDPASECSRARFGDGEMRAIEQEQPPKPNQDQRQDLQHGRRHLYLAGTADTPEVDYRQQPERPNGKEGSRRGAANQGRHERIEVSDEGNRERRVRRPGGDPIPPCDEKPGKIAKRG